MSRSAAGPGHFESVDPDEVAFLRGDCSRALASFRPGSIYFLCILITKVRRSCAGKSALSLKGVGVVGQCKEIQIRHIRRMLKRLLHGSCTVGKVRVSVKLPEIQAVVIDHHGRFVCKGINLSGLGFGICIRRNICQGFYDDRFVFGRSLRDLDGFAVFLLFSSSNRISRLRSVCIHGVVDFCAVSRLKGDLLLCHHAGAALRSRLHFKAFHCGRLIRFIRDVSHLIECKCEHPLTAGRDIIICAPVAVAVIPLHVGVADGILHIVKSISGILQHPLVVLLAQRHAGIAVSHTDILAVAGEAVGPVSVILYRPDIFLRITRKASIPGLRHIGSFIVKTGIFSRKSLHIRRRIDDHLVAVRDRNCRFRIRRDRFVHFVEGKLELIIRCSAVGIVSTPVAVLSIPFHVIAPAGILNVIQTVPKIDHFPVVMSLPQIHACITVSQADILSILAETVGPIVIYCDRPDIRIRIPGHHSV